MTNLSPTATRWLWIGLLIAASIGASKALACMMPFAAVAALAALRFNRRDTLTLMFGCWAVNQAVGFAIQGWPHDPTTLGWVPGIAVAALGAGLGASFAQQRVSGKPELAQLLVGYLGATILFKVALVGWATTLADGPLVSVQPSLLAMQLPRDFAIAVALWALYRGLVALGVPAVRVPGRALAA